MQPKIIYFLIKYWRYIDGHLVDHFIEFKLDRNDLKFIKFLR